MTLNMFTTHDIDKVYHIVTKERVYLSQHSFSILYKDTERYSIDRFNSRRLIF
jgi:hypothetical protein